MRSRRNIDAREVAAEVVRRAMADAACGNGYVVRLNDPPTPHERLQLLAARLEARPIAVLPHVCRSIDEWAERYASLAQP
jgi:hypothetical protein